MNTLEFVKFKIKGAELGELNCLPDIKNDSYIHAKINVSDDISEEDKKYIGKGMINTLLPYQIQDGYSRERKDLEFDAVVLENDYLKAVFVTELGGRLWSLFDKKENKELLYANDVFQPGNLALRNAWFSGGVEWNLGIKGHNPLTCSPMFAQKLTDKQGNPMLRMYEFERIREVAYSIVAKLEKDVLLVNVTIENTENKDKYMYWWSNIAVEETKNTRVIVPAPQSFYCSYEENGYFLNITDLPVMNGTDVTYASNLGQSRDFFYKIPENEKKWITAVDENGYGLIHISTSELVGRKMFAWGQGNGGRHWNNWLSDCGKNYIEIQAGLLKTQLEHFVMKANSKISWTEGYSAVKADKDNVHNEDLIVAIDEVKSHISDKQFVVENADFVAINEDDVIYYGSGWGAIQESITNNKVSDIVKFPVNSLNDETKEWEHLLKNGDFSEHNVNDVVKSYVKGSAWIEKIKAAHDSWYKYYHLGIVYYVQEDVSKAFECFKKSIELSPNAWALRNLSQIEKNENNNLEAAANYITEAVKIKSDYQPLWVNYAEIMINMENYNSWIDKYENLDNELKENGRLKMLYALALIRVNRAKEALSIITSDKFILPDIKEGEFSISHMWLEIHRNLMGKDVDEITDKEVYEMYPLPLELDFRMH